MEATLYWQWAIVIIPSLIFLVTSPLAKTKNAFFKASENNKPPSAFMLTGSLVISWIFAKSITNAANLGLSFGIVGGVAYSVYYLSFVVAAFTIRSLRNKGFKSFHDFLQSKFGRTSLIIFSLLISFRLFNEIWSNTMVIGSYFGETGSTQFYLSIIVFTVLTLGYVLKGGLSSSIRTDVIQVFFFFILLIIILVTLFSDAEFGVQTIVESGTWSLSTGVNLILVALLQVLSYPFHDPVMTDRGFISDIKTTFRSFLIASAIGVVCIILFSFIGVYAQSKGFSGQAAVAVGKSLGLVIMLIINFIMITSAASTMDSTFSSFAKLIAFDLGLGKTITAGRLAMIFVAIVGSIPVFLGAEILSATTVSGTMVMGLAPVFLLHKMPAPKLSFYLSIGSGVFFGYLLLTHNLPANFMISNGSHNELLSVNFWGVISCFTFFLIPVIVRKLATLKKQ